MVAGLVLQGVVGVGFLTAAAAGVAYIDRQFPGLFPRSRTRLDPRSYRVVRSAVALGAVLGGFGAVLSLVDTVGTIRALSESATGLLAGVALLVPAWLGPTMTKVGVGLLLGGGLVAGGVELLNARA